MRKGKNGYIVEVNEWGCGLMIKDTQTGREIDAPDDEVITLCIKEMNSLAKELDNVRSVAEDNKTVSEPTRLKVGRIGTTEMIDCVSYEDYARLKAQVERLTKAGDAMAKLLSCCGNPQSEVRGWNAAKEGKQP